ncbi:MAG TPA: aminoglycoside phosphotransferase family protein [Pyrinomonadaceae bacterium]
MSDDVRLASAIVTETMGGPAARVTPVVGKGSVNKVFVAETSGGKVVVRVSDRPQAADEYAKEAWCIERAAALGVHVPEVLGVGQRDGHAFIVESFVEGDEGRDSRADRADLWRVLGAYARLIHTVAVPGLGLTMAEITEGDARKEWSRHLEYNIESLTDDDPLLGLKVATREQSRAAREVFVWLRGREFVFGLNHGDLSLKNTIVDARGVVTLLDWGSAEAAAVPHHDLIQLLKMSMKEDDPDGEEFRSFLDGYGIGTDELERMMPELEALLLLRAFDKLRWALEWKAEPLAGYVGHAREAAQRCLRRA